MMKVSVRAIMIALAGNLWLVLHFLAIYISLNIMSLEREDYVVTEKLSLQIYVVGAVKGSLFFCGLAHYLGRKNSISSTGLPLAVGYLLSFTENIGVFCCGKFLIGFSWGGTLAVLPIYFGEIATKSSRGIMLSTIVVSFQIGGILSMNINRFDSRIILKCVVPGLAVLFSIFFFFFGMETPHYYLLKNDKIISKSALEKLRNTTQNEIEKEFKEMQGDIIHTGEEKVMACFKANGWVKSVFVLLCLNFLQSLSVVNFMRILATEVFDRAGFNITVPQMFMIVDEFNLQQIKSKVYLQFDTKYTGHNNVSLRRRWQIALRPTKKAKKFRKDVEELEKLCTDGIGAAGALFCLLLIDWIGRKKCLILSATGVSLSLLMFELFRSYEDSYIPLFFFASSIIFLYMGIIPVREVFLGELFSLKFKMAGVALVNMHFFSMGLLLSYFSLTTYDLVNTNGSFYFGMIVCAVAAIFINFCIPETKGKSLEHIQVILNRT